MRRHAVSVLSVMSSIACYSLVKPRCACMTCRATTLKGGRVIRRNIHLQHLMNALERFQDFFGSCDVSIQTAFK